MDFVSHDARCARLGPDGAAQRATWEVSARKGNAHAQAMLDGPEFPAELQYLYDWFQELSDARSEGINGPAPLTHHDIAAWAALTDRTPSPHEVQGLLALDLAWRMALRDETPRKTSEGVIAPAVGAWPAPKPTDA